MSMQDNIAKKILERLKLKTPGIYQEIMLRLPDNIAAPVAAQPSLLSQIGAALGVVIKDGAQFYKDKEIAKAQAKMAAIEAERVFREEQAALTRLRMQTRQMEERRRLEEQQKMLEENRSQFFGDIFRPNNLMLLALAGSLAYLLGSGYFSQ